MLDGALCFISSLYSSVGGRIWIKCVLLRASRICSGIDSLGLIIKVTVVSVLDFFLGYTSCSDIVSIFGLLECCVRLFRIVQIAAEDAVHSRARDVVFIMVVGIEHIAICHFIEVISCEVAFLDDNIVEELLLVGFAKDVRFYGMFADETIDVDVTSLSDTMGTICALFVHGRIPIKVVEDDCICPRQVDTETSRSRRENEAEDARVVVESVGENLSLFDLCCAVEAEVAMAVDVEELFQYVENFGHLSEDEGSMSARLEPTEKFVQTLQFTTIVLEKSFVRERDR